MTVEAIARRVAGETRPVILIDGRSGSGKTTLAPLVAERIDAQLVRLDMIYPGWSGLQAGSDAVYQHLLDARNPRWQRWDWALAAPAEWHAIDPERALVIEGCGALSARNRVLASLGVWVELDTATRKQRALERDGESYRPWWDHWAAQEDSFIARERPQQLADLVVAPVG